MKKITVLGAGSWGTALSVHLAGAGHTVRLWARDQALTDDISVRRANRIYLPEIRLPDRVSVTSSLVEALEDAALVVAAVPSHGLREVVRAARPHIAGRPTFVSATKGLEQQTFRRMSEVLG